MVIWIILSFVNFIFNGFYASCLVASFQIQEPISPHTTSFGFDRLWYIPVELNPGMYCKKPYMIKGFEHDVCDPFICNDMQQAHT